MEAQNLRQLCFGFDRDELCILCMNCGLSSCFSLIYIYIYVSKDEIIQGVKNKIESALAEELDDKF